MAEPANLPKWAIHNVKSIHKDTDGVWHIDTPRGPGRFLAHFQAALGILDHEFVDAEESHWRVYARVVPVVDAECQYMLTLTKPPQLSDRDFDAGMRLMDDELKALKRRCEELVRLPVVPSG